MALNKTVFRESHLRVLDPLAVLEDSVGDALARLPVARLLPIPADGRAEAHGDPRVLLQLLERDVEAGVLPRLNQQLVDHRPHHRGCDTERHGCLQCSLVGHELSSPAWVSVRSL